MRLHVQFGSCPNVDGARTDHLGRRWRSSRGPRTKLGALPTVGDEGGEKSSTRDGEAGPRQQEVRRQQPRRALSALRGRGCSGRGRGHVSNAVVT